MKLNFWQWLGIVCLIVGAIGYIAFKDRDNKPSRVQPAPTQEAPAVQPAPPAPVTPLPPTTGQAS